MSLQLGQSESVSECQAPRDTFVETVACNIYFCQFKRLFSWSENIVLVDFDKKAN